jgi:peptide/nickel transport system substrate-binding protein
MTGCGGKPISRGNASRCAGFEKLVLDTEAHEILLLWRRIVPYRSFVKGWKVSPSYYVNQVLATIWLDK